MARQSLGTSPIHIGISRLCLCCAQSTASRADAMVHPCCQWHLHWQGRAGLL